MGATGICLKILLLHSKAVALFADLRLSPQALGAFYDLRALAVGAELNRDLRLLARIAARRT